MEAAWALLAAAEEASLVPDLMLVVAMAMAVVVLPMPVVLVAVARC